MSYTAHEETIGKYTIKIQHDGMAENPREWENLGKMVCWHSRHNLGDEQPSEDSREFFKSLLKCDYWREIENTEDYQALSKNDDDCDIDYYIDELADESVITKLIERFFFVLPLYLYDHSGITMRTSSFSSAWDSGQVGFIYVSKQDVMKEWNVTSITPELEKTIYKNLDGEVKTYDDYLTGNVYGYIIEDEDENHIDSCWGFYPDHEGEPDYDYCLTEVKSVVLWQIKEDERILAEEERAELLQEEKNIESVIMLSGSVL